MLLLVLLFIVIGDFMDAVPAIIIFMPIVIKLNELGNIKPLHMGVVLITTLVFGLITPPYGLSLLVASKFVGVRFSAAMFASLPIYVVFFVTIAFTVLFPDVVLYLPKLFLPEVGRLLQEPDAGRWDNHLLRQSPAMQRARKIVKPRRIVDQYAPADRVVGGPFVEQVEQVAGVRHLVLHARMRPVGAPDQLLGIFRDQRLVQGARVRIVRRARG